MPSPRSANFDYQRYLASREWSLLREQVRERSGNRCEHCFVVPQQAVHHLTYARLGHEELDDLMAVCNECHEWLSGKSDTNPLNDWCVVSDPLFARDGRSFHLLVPLMGLQGRGTSCTGADCIWCNYVYSGWRRFHGFWRQRQDRVGGGRLNVRGPFLPPLPEKVPL